MFFKREVQILDMLTEHWMSYVILCNPRLLQSAGRKLVGVLKLLSMLKSKGQFHELSLCSVFSHKYQTRLPALTVKTQSVEMQVEFYIDPIESQEGKLRFHLVFTVQGLMFDEVEVAWSSKRGPDLIHAYFLLETIERVEAKRLKRIAKLRAHVKLESLLKRYRRTWDIEFQNLDGRFLIFYQGEEIGSIYLIDSGDGYITSYTLNPRTSYNSLQFRTKSLDAMVL